MTLTVEARLLRRTRKTKACWVWEGAKTKQGYGLIYANGKKNCLTHRVAYELWKGSIPAGLEIDHLCNNTSCLRPSHLKAVTPKQNSARRNMANIGQHQRDKTHCPAGHDYKTHGRVRPYDGARVCRTCDAERRAAKRK